MVSTVCVHACVRLCVKLLLTYLMKVGKKRVNKYSLSNLKESLESLNIKSLYEKQETKTCSKYCFLSS